MAHWAAERRGLGDRMGVRPRQAAAAHRSPGCESRGTLRVQETGLWGRKEGCARRAAPEPSTGGTR